MSHPTSMMPHPSSRVSYPIITVLNASSVISLLPPVVTCPFYHIIPSKHYVNQFFLQGVRSILLCSTLLQGVQSYLFGFHTVNPKCHAKPIWNPILPLWCKTHHSWCITPLLECLANYRSIVSNPSSRVPLLNII